MNKIKTHNKNKIEKLYQPPEYEENEFLDERYVSSFKDK